MRLSSEDKQAHHCKVRKMFYRCLVDAAGIGGRKMLLPGEVFRSTSLDQKKSAEVIVPESNEPDKRAGGLTIWGRAEH
jgi:hypothetical protein